MRDIFCHLSKFILFGECVCVLSVRRNILGLPMKYFQVACSESEVRTRRGAENDGLALLNIAKDDGENSRIIGSSARLRVWRDDNMATRQQLTRKDHIFTDINSIISSCAAIITANNTSPLAAIVLPSNYALSYC